MGPGRKQQVSDEDLLDVFRRADDPVLTTSEVASRVPISRRRVLDRLGELRDAGLLERKDVGARGQVWWLAEARDRPDYSAGFGALKGTGFGSDVAEAREELAEGFEKREHDLFGN